MFPLTREEAALAKATFQLAKEMVSLAMEVLSFATTSDTSELQIGRG